jgi:hypothetical protein
LLKASSFYLELVPDLLRHLFPVNNNSHCNITVILPLSGKKGFED